MDPLQRPELQILLEEDGQSAWIDGSDSVAQGDKTQRK